MAIKQVIVVRKDLGMRKGKIAAQVAHASLGIFFDRMGVLDRYYDGSVRFALYLERDMAVWAEESFTKVVLGCDSYDELRDIFQKASVAGLPVKLITDAGRTEFHGNPTDTCVAIGPADEKDIDSITGHLKLI